MDPLSPVEIGAIGVFAYLVVCKLIDLIKDHMPSAEKTAQTEFYKSFSKFQIEWRVYTQRNQDQFDSIKEKLDKLQT